MKFLLSILSIVWVLLAEPFALNGDRDRVGPGTLHAAQPFDEVLQTTHNFLTRRDLGNREKVCLSCHTDGRALGAPLPDSAKPRVPAEPDKTSGLPSIAKTAAAPLWSPGQSPERYSLPGARGRPPGKTDRRPFGSSYACLGCHDGALAEDVHGEKKGLDKNQPPSDRSLDHPSSIRYPRRPDGVFVAERPTTGSLRYWSIADLTAEGLVMPSGPVSTYFGGIPGMDPADPAVSASVVRTSFGIMHCDSCHNPHANRHPPYLRAPDRDLCFVCHDR